MTQSPEANPIKVSVSIITYNQVEYIHKAIEGALKQKTDFPYEIIIGDDGSTDGTRETLLEYKERYPDLIRLNLHDEHWDEGIPGRLNNITNIRSAKGKYIAFCDGDDYWISEDKLQKQADFMDANPEYSFCFHDAVFKKTTKEYLASRRYFYLRKERNFSLQDLAKQNIDLPSSSIFFRTEKVKKLPGWFWNVYTADFALELYATQFGPAKYLKAKCSVQRKDLVSESDNFFSEENHEKIRINDTAIYRKELKLDQKYFWDPVSEAMYGNAAQAFKKFHFVKGIRYLTKSILYDSQTLRKLLNTFVSRLYFHTGNFIKS